MHITQQKLLKLVDTYNIGSMSFRDIARIIGEEHPQTVKHHLEQLEKKQLVKWDRDNNVVERVLPGVTANIDFITVPVMGAANCGIANIYSDECIIGHIKVSTTVLGNRRKVFAIRAVGHSMNTARVSGRNIEDGDYVIIDFEDRQIHSNDYVLSIIDEVANIKKVMFDKINCQIALISESTFKYPEIYIDFNEAGRYFFNGKVVHVVKQMKFDANL